MDEQRSLEMEYTVDFVICIDATSSMKPFIHEVKTNILKFFPAFRECLEMHCLTLDYCHYRVKIIAFRDYDCRDCSAMVESDFFVLPDGEKRLHAFLDEIEARGGGDYRKNALEAVALALKSKWMTEGDKRRHVILVFTDNAALPLDARVSNPKYPNGMPKSIDELKSWWEENSHIPNGTNEADEGRMVVFAPADRYPWNMVADWENVWICDSNAGHGLLELAMNPILDMIFLA